MAADKEKQAKLKALQLTLDKLDKTYGKGSVMKMGDSVIEEVEAISSGSLGLDLALGVGGTTPLQITTGKSTIFENSGYGGVFVGWKHVIPGSFAYELKIYYGETLDEEGIPIQKISEEKDGKVVEKDIENIFVSFYISV